MRSDIPTVRFARRHDGLRVAYQVVGEGPDLIFLLGWPSHLLLQWELPAFARFLEQRQHERERNGGRNSAADSLHRTCSDELSLRRRHAARK